ncbi:MAG: hypothetical protein WD534_08710 [Phycisphaeraceae bacterium]
MGRKNPAHPGRTPSPETVRQAIGIGETRSSSRSLLDKVQTGVIVSVIAVLVWLYAEGEAVQERPKQIEIQFVAAGSGPVGIDPSRPFLIGVTFQASTGQMAQVEHLLSQGPVQIPVAPREDADSPMQTVVLREALERSMLGELGVNIRETSPATWQVAVEPLETVELDVTLEVAQPELVGPRPRIEPSRVAVTVPASQRARVAELQAVARLDDVGALEPDQQHTVDLRVSLSEAVNLRWMRVQPETVEVTFTLREQTDTVTLTSVPIEVQVSPLLLRRYMIDVSDEHMVLRDVVLTGPADEIDRIRRKERPIRAYLRPTADELDRGVEMLNVDLDKPSAVAIETPLPAVPVQVTQRE